MLDFDRSKLRIFFGLGISEALVSQCHYANDNNTYEFHEVAFA